MASTPTLQGQTFTVTQITDILKNVIESSFRGICVEGEISNITSSGPGHLYLTLKDQTAQISCAMFRNAAQYLAFRPKTGDKVRCFGSLSVYPPRGNYQLIITKMEIAGVGDILLMLNQRKQKLASEGLFDQAHKKPLPLFPRTIGVVTSPTGAAIRDIMQTTKRRNPHISIIVFPCLVQGDTAAPTICKMIHLANYYKMCDVLIVGRGGGSIEDLLPFSEESVVRAIYDSEIPTISAVGHEIDWSLADFAADVRAATPTAAAELAVPVYAEIKQRLQYYQNELYNNISQNVRQKQLMVKSFKPENLAVQFRTIELPYLNRFENAKRNLVENINNRLRNLRQTIDSSITVLENASPAKIFDRGYSMVRDKETGKIITDAALTEKGQELEIIPAKGKITAIVQ